MADSTIREPREAPASSRREAALIEALIAQCPTGYLASDTLPEGVTPLTGRAQSGPGAVAMIPTDHGRFVFEVATENPELLRYWFGRPESETLAAVEAKQRQWRAQLTAGQLNASRMLQVVGLGDLTRLRRAWQWCDALGRVIETEWIDAEGQPRWAVNGIDWPETPAPRFEKAVAA